jgi:EmrB/QacA subfamily drug resistance transporter
MFKKSPQIQNKWFALAAAGMATFTNTLDGNIVKIALPTFTQVFDVSPNVVVWVALVNYLTLAGLMLTFAMVADVVGRKKLFTMGFAIITAGLALCPMAQNIGQLIAFRAIQSVGGAMIGSVWVAILIAAFPPEERGKALGITSITVGLGITTGPVLGGFLIDLLGWQALFYARIPLGIAGLVVSWAWLRDETRPSTNRRLDISGSILLFTAIVLLMLGINQGQPQGWSSPLVLGLLLLAGILFGTLYLFERRRVFPAVDFTLLKNRLFLGSLLTLFFRNLAQMVVLIVTPFYLIQARLFSSSLSGIFLMLVPLGLLTFGPLCGWLSDKVSRRLLSTAGVGVMFFGMLMLSRLDMDSYITGIVLPLVLVGVGLGIFEAPNMGIMMGAHSKDKLNAASAMIATMRQISHATGVAVGGAVFVSRQLFHSSQLAVQALEPAMQHRLSVARGFHDAMLVTAAIGLMAVLASLVREKA